MARLKSGELIAASIMVGAALAGRPRAEVRDLGEAGRLAGEAFQIQDDILNLTGDPSLTGKAVGTDATRGKASPLGLLGPEGARELAARLMAEAQAIIRPLGSDILPPLLDSLVDRER